MKKMLWFTSPNPDCVDIVKCPTLTYRTDAQPRTATTIGALISAARPIALREGHRSREAAYTTNAGSRNTKKRNCGRTRIAAAARIPIATTIAPDARPLRMRCKTNKRAVTVSTAMAVDSVSVASTPSRKSCCRLRLCSRPTAKPSTGRPVIRSVMANRSADVSTPSVICAKL
jgi:hypothetical protein